MMRRITYVAAVFAVMAAAAGAAQAAPPMVLGTWATDVGSNSANLRAQINGEGQPTTYLFEYTTDTAYRANGFAGAARIPSVGVTIAGGTVLQHTGGLEAETTYRYRVVATSSNGVVAGPVRTLTTREPSPVFKLPDSRGWEMVSPADKNGGGIQDFGQTFGGGVFQAAAQGGAFTYTSAASFQNPLGSPGSSQYFSRREATGWSTQNITPPAGVSGGYPESPTSGVPYQLFSSSLESALLNNGRRCRTSVSSHCPVENPPLEGSEAPAGFRDYYVRDNADGSVSALLKSADLAHLALGAEDFELAFAGATPDLAHVVLSTCAALTAAATEVAGSEGECDPAKQNLYVKSGAAAPVLVNLLPGDSTGTPGAALAAQSGAISADGSRVYWTEGGKLFLRDGSQTKEVDVGQGGGGTFQTASVDGSVAYFTDQVGGSAHLFRYVAATASAEDLTPLGGVVGVAGASADGSFVYYVTGEGLFLWHAGVVTQVAPEVDPDSYPPATGNAQVSPDGRHLVFVSSAYELTPYDSRDTSTETPSPEVYLFTAPGSAGSGVVCVSCNPFGERPRGAAGLPGASPNGAAFQAYKPRVLSADAKRVFFDTDDSLASQDTDGAEDVYEWEALGEGSCAKAAGCVSLISSGRSEDGSSLLDASADGSDVFFLTDESLVPSDPGAADVYDARVEGGFPVPPAVVPCFGDACQPLPPEPEDPNPGTQRNKPSGNLPTPPPKKPLTCKKGKVKRFGKCVNKPHKGKKKANKKRKGHR